ncbi:MAG: cation transporter [Filifactor alocis]|nr:cation transporter [Filifactor alocis]
MKKTYKIEVDCANCANLMEEEARKTKGVKSATISFMTQKMRVEFEDGEDEEVVMKNVLKACKKIEPDCEIEL